jgi:hypothetical protein
VTIQAIAPSDNDKQVEGVAVIVEHAGGKRERLTTNSNGKVTFRHKKAVGYSIKIDGGGS